MRHLCAALIAAISFSHVSLAEENLQAMVDKISGYLKEGNYQKALEETGWLRTELEKKSSQSIASLFPKELAGYTAGPVETNSAMGFTTIETKYTSGSRAVTATLMSGGQGAFGGLAALGQMAAMYGGQNTLRVNGRTAMQDGEGLTVNLDGGAMLKFDPSGDATSSNVKEFAQAFPFDKIEAYLKGAAQK